MNKYPDPCITCDQSRCQKNCQRWKTRYLYRQKQINAYAKVNGIVPGAPEYHEGKHPCRECPREDKCNGICKARAKYWDETMAKIRKNWHAEA